MIFTPEELEGLRRADAEIEERYRAQHAAYREANKEKYNAYMREYMRRKRAAKKAGDCANV